MNFNKLKDQKLTRIAMFIFAVFAGCIIIYGIMINAGDIIGAVGDFISWVMSVLAGLVGGFVLAYLLYPLVEWEQGILKRIPLLKNKDNTSRALAIALTYILILLVIVVALAALVIAITRQVTSIDFNNLPSLIRQAQVQILGYADTIVRGLEKLGIATESVEEWLDSVGDTASGAIAGLGTGAFGFANSFAGLMSDILFAVIFSIYFLIDTDGLIRYWSDAFKAILGERIHHWLKVLILDADACFSGYIRGQFLDAAFVAVVFSIALSIVSVPYALAIGIASGIGNLIPYVGPIVAYGMTIVVCIATGKWKTLAAAIIIIFILQTIDGNVINPRLLSTSIDVHPALVIVGLLFGGSIGGVLGMLLAVPVAAFIKIQFEKIVSYRRSAARVSGEGPDKDDGGEDK